MIRSLLFFVLAVLSFYSYSQGGAACAEMAPICTDVGLNFTANAGIDQAGTTDPGNDYDCLFSQPNPTWYYFQIATDGDIIMELSADQDIDYAIWGPFSTLSVAQAACNSMGDQSPPNPDNGNIVDCSFSPTAIETPTITGAITGEVYVMLITNYAGVVQDISLSQTSGTGSTDCNIVTNPPCSISALNANPSGCDFTTNTYSVSGTIEFTSPPSSGSLVVEDCNGNITTVDNFPFASSPQNFSITGLASDGLPCDVEVYFTADPACTQQYNYTAPVCVNNCPTYDLFASSPTEACGNQQYFLEVQNSACDGTVNFEVSGDYGSFPTEISWYVTSNLTGNQVASGSGGASGGTFNVAVGPIDPNVEGTIFNLVVEDSWGDGFSGGGFIQTESTDGTILGGPIAGNFGVFANSYFNSGIIVSSSTITVTTPTGTVTSVIGNCADHSVPVTLQNNNYCTPIVVDLPWMIMCDITGTLIASGTHSVTVYPQVPTSASDLVSIDWNASTCSWDVTPQNDCDALDLNVLYSISPDPSTLGSACANGTEEFTVTYLGFTNGPDCCSTGGPLTPATYTNNQGTTDFITQTAYGGTNNAAYGSVPGSGIGGNSTDVTIDISGSGYCFPDVPAPPGPPVAGEDDYYVDIYVDGVQIAIYGPLSDPPGSFNYSFTHADLLAAGVTYNQNSVVEVYVLPNQFFDPGPPQINTVYIPGANCNTLAAGEWSASNFSIDVQATYEQLVPSPANCTFTVNESFTCCATAPLTATAPANQNVECIGDVPAVDINSVTNIVSDCPATVTFVSDASDGNTCPEVITRTYSVTDDCGNSINVTQTITVNDITPPTASNPGGIDVECVGDVPAADISVVTDAADNCTALPVVAFVSDASDGNTCPEVITRTYSVTDDCGNSINVTQTITVNDITPPTASNPGGIDVECVGDVPAADISVVTDAADNCTALPVVAFVSDASDGNTCPEVITRTYSVTDDCGNSINVTQTITVNDITPPTASNPGGIDVECVGDVPAADISVVTDAADNCTALPVVAFVSDASDGNTCPEVITRTYSVTDDCGNSINVTQTITVNDITPPTASNPGGIDVECVGDVPAADISVVTDAADNCTALPVVAFVSDASDGNTCPEVITRTYSVTDDCGNSINVTQTITVNDITPPTASNPGGIDVECVGDVPAADISVVTDAADNCTALPVVAFVSDASDGNTCPEVITRTYSVTDDCGNSINVTQTITVNDITPPTASNPGGIDVECVGDVPAADISVVTDAADNCTALPVVAFVSDASDGNTCPEVITRTYSVTDDCGNSINVTQTITVNDITPPTASNPGGIDVECVGDVPAADISVVTDAADNCTALPVVAFVSDASDGNTCPEVITRTYSVTDDCGNSINVTQTITVNDITPPTASNPPNINISLAPAPSPDITEVTDAADNCTVAPIVTFVSDQSDGGDCPEVISRTYSVNDDCGNETIVTQLIIIGGGLVPTPTVTANSPICDGEDAVFTINGLADAVVTYDTGGGSQTLTLLGGAGVVTVPAATSNVTITLSNIADGNCDSDINETLTVEVNPSETPSFNTLGPYCVNGTTDVLPNVSLEGYSGIWTPSSIDVDNSGTTTYTFVPDFAACITDATMNVIVNEEPFVLAAAIDSSICEGDSVILFIDSLSGGQLVEQFIMTFNEAFSYTTINTNLPGSYYVEVSGTYSGSGACELRDAAYWFYQGCSNVTPIQEYPWKWNGSPPFTQATCPYTYNSNHNYNFFFDGGGAQTFSFSEANAAWYGDNSGSLSFNVYYLGDITWSTGSNAAADTIVPPVGQNIYSVTLDYGNGCTATDDLSIEVLPSIDPEFTQIDPVCLNSPEIPFPVISNNGISGIWSTPNLITNIPGLIEVTFFPDPGQCASNATMNILINDLNQPNFDQLGPYCEGDSPGILLGVSNEGITGSWSPNVIDPLLIGTTTYTFTPDPAQCASATTMDIEITAPIVPTFTQIDDLCEGAEVFPGGSPFPVASTEGIIGVWAPVFDAFNTTTYTFTPDPAFCATTTTMTINIVGFPVVDAGGDQIITCINNVDGAQIGSPEVTGNTYSWSPTTGLSNPNIANPIANPSTATTYTLTVTNSTGCSSDGTVNVTIDDTPPIVSITNNTGSSTLTCTQLDISVTATGADSYTWDNGLGNNAAATITSPGIYTVTGTSLNGCSSTQSIEIFQDNNVDLFVVLSDPEICSGEEVLITANSANATGFDWIVLQNGVSGASAGTISNTPSGAEIMQALQLTGVNNGSVEYTITPNFRRMHRSVTNRDC